ncbi:MAG: hypothetical protein NTX03_02155 [Bacteroidetes bacterium]|nr:hypothetical protein [Bacteroidota bacterium]
MFDTSNYTFGIKDIATHIHTNLKVPETVSMQLRLKRKWEIFGGILHENTHSSINSIYMWQLERISLLVDFVFSNHPFYHQLYKSVGYKRGDIISWDDYNSLPCISKKDIIDNYDMFSKANIAPSIHDCYTSRTSGSSGKTLTVLKDSTTIDENMLIYFRFYDQILGRPRRSTEWLYDIYLASPPFSSLDGQFPVFTVSNNCPIHSVLDHIRLIKPIILNGFPSYLERLGSIITDTEDLGIKAIITNSESSTEAQRQKISQQFGASVYDEYSSVELSYIATQCNQKKYHIVEDNVRVDVLNPDENGMGEIVATNLHNSYMPFIRYRQGDIIKIGDTTESCSCGNRFRHLQSFLGRTDQFLYSQIIGKVSPDLIMSLYDSTLILKEANIDEFQIVQKKLNEVILVVVPSDKSKDINNKILLKFESGLRDIFKDNNLSILVEKFDLMPQEKSHKRRLIKCEINP